MSSTDEARLCPRFRELGYHLVDGSKGSQVGPDACPDRHHETAKKLIAQLTSRWVKYAQDGRLWLENKQEMRERGVRSPDLADAFVMAFAKQPARGYNWTPVNKNWPDIARRHGWQYTSDSREVYDDSYADRRTWNRQPADDSPIAGMGGVWSQW